MVAHDKYHADGFREELIEKAVDILSKRLGEEDYSIVTYVPSARNNKVAEFARQVAERLGYEYKELLGATGEGSQQKTMQNTYFQYKNALEKIRIKSDIIGIEGANIILIDDLVDSK